MSDLSLSSVASVAQGTGDVIGKADPISNLIDVGASLLGLPPEMKNVAKVAAGVAIANPVLVVSGAVGLTGSVLGAGANASAAATTEYVPRPGNPTVTGYARGAVRPSSADDGLPPLEPLVAETVAPRIAVAGGSRNAAAAPPPSPEPAGEARTRNEPAATSGRKSEVFLLAERMAASVGRPVQRQPPGESGPGGPGPSGEPGTRPELPGPEVPGGTQGPGAGGAGIDPKLAEYREHLEVLQNNFAALDAADRKDGVFSKHGLLLSLDDPNTPPEVRGAAQFLLDNPEYFNRLELAAGIGWQDGMVGMPDIRAELRRVDAQLAASEPPADAPVYGDGPVAVTPGQGYLRHILNAPGLSIEEKLMALLEGGLQSVDRELQGMMGELVTLQTRKGNTRDAKKAGELDTQLQLLQFRIQRAVERRSQMFQLMSTLSEKFNEMAKVAIQNMGRA